MYDTACFHPSFYESSLVGSIVDKASIMRMVCFICTRSLRCSVPELFGSLISNSYTIKIVIRTANVKNAPLITPVVTDFPCGMLKYIGLE